MAANTQRTPFFLPPGRIVNGSVYELQTEDQHGKTKEKPNIYFGVAVPKTDPGVAEVLQIINQVAYGYYGNTALKDQLALGLNAPNFSWKVDDGDLEKNKGKEGFAGCWVFRFSTSIFPIKTADSQNNPIDPKMVETGYYIDVAGSCAPNELMDKNAGVYLNPNGVRLLGYAPIILQGPSVSQLFAQRAAVLPAGASALPVATGNPPGNPPGNPAPALGGQPAPVAPPAGIGGIGGQPVPPAGPGLAGPPPLANTPAPPPPAGLVAAPPPPPPAPVQTVETIQAESAAIAAAAGVQHYPGHRLKADRSGYDPDPTPVPTATPPAGMPTTGLAVGVSHPSSPLGAVAQGVPAGAQPGQAALGIGPNGSTTVSPGSVQPHPGFLNPPPTQTADEISAQIAAANQVQHYAGYRFDVGTRTYQANPQ